MALAASGVGSNPCQDLSIDGAGWQWESPMEWFLTPTKSCDKKGANLFTYHLRPTRKLLIDNVRDIKM